MNTRGDLDERAHHAEAYEAERARCERCAAVRDISAAFWRGQERLVDTNHDRAYCEKYAADDEALAHAWRERAHEWQVSRDAALAARGVSLLTPGKLAVTPRWP